MTSDRPGRVIFISAWTANALFAVTAAPVALGVESLDIPAVVVAVALFLISLPTWGYAFVVAVTRSAQGDDVTLGRMFLFDPGSPHYAQWQLYGALAACVAIAAATAVGNPFGVLVPMLPLGLVGLWGARHRQYPPRAAYPQGRKGSA